MSKDESTIDVQKLLRQQLISLARAGVTDLSASAGEYEFSFEESSEPESASSKSVSPSSDAAQSQTASSVKSSPPPAESSATSKSPATPKSPASLETELSSQPSTSTNRSGEVSSDSPYPGSIPADQRESALTVISEEVQSCTQCPELCTHRAHTVFGVGNPNTRLVFIGEGPGADEDRTGIPFVGAAGKLLDKILVASKIDRDEVYILNTVKCRPPGNRNPTEVELGNCWNYAERQLEVLQPEFICCLGSVAAKTLLKSTQSLGRLRQKFHQYRSSRVMVTYHPAYLLRNERAKVHVWNDMKMLMKEMGVDLSKDN
jgi:DNA polymerase